MKKVVLALGGNALGNSPEEQIKAVRKTAVSIVDLVEDGNEVIVCHGNGPQVGMINLAMETAHNSNPQISNMPFAECVAMSQGYIGYHLQKAIKNELSKRNMKNAVSTIITQVKVDKDDEAFANPTKPVGLFYSKEESEKLAAESGYTFKEDANRGYRRVVPSPKPIDIIEKEEINTLIKKDFIVIAGGGGGIPVVENDGQLEGIGAVIDKDFTSEKLAEISDADLLIILTAVEKVCINYGTENEEGLDELNLSRAQKLIEEKQFAEGSMLPKVKACLNFIQSGEGKIALITSLEKAKEGINGLTGTRFVK
ncbi:carbamate kinase [Finegoldia sp. BIOML-A2]|uniref:Carbamate kinase n=2 Tax=Finegoldia magna TaxID=1260 RepID=D6SBC7_FINMA|nr:MULTISPECIES: carbamate kinase [Finegoldia]EFH92777.1 carbamate kinase [Finegoldia magna ATCC 53516]MDU1398868.1 carbamate kinase [Finegoldia magna]MDU2384109.1 carbamate kinase [Finegoldia magna]MDU4277961.1 carbamate kinase [Finegoldia magna]MDU6552004.1 carbamate kinase [Finegoldia magna]